MNAAIAMQPDLMLSVNDLSILPSLKKVLRAIPGVTLMPVRRKKSFVPTAETLARMEAGREEIHQGRCVTCKTYEDIDYFLASL